MKAHKFSKQAQEKIKAAGGSIRGGQLTPCLIASEISSAFPDLRRRVLFTFMILAVYRIGGHIPTPGIDSDALKQFFAASRAACSASWTCSPAATSALTIFALGIMPYISASIILQLLTVIWPYLEKLSQGGRRRPQEDHAVHALRHRVALGGPVLRHRCGSRVMQGGSGGAATPAGASAHDRPHPDHGDGVHHVVG